ncbi:acyl--CoA ligase [Novosphingobium sp. G106]|uniref:class I adenylate-forming enzyme family protein n=1 Tax=Novosphingobium sp. G106 TaxID=2849500 RepID=UPI001C2D422D|nr:class I adenylate-forming enzyme family protein [Novosphingobium sp. G106]MBV1689019.1 acyl--CoA ligase [Novosphingobium sp. G106]
MHPQTVFERRRAIAGRHPAWTWPSLQAYLDWSLADFGGRPLVITDGQTFSYDEVAELSRQMAAGISSRGIVKGDRVGIVMANDPMTVPLLFAIWRAGAVAVPLNTLYRIDELEFALREAGCALLVTMSGFGSRNLETEIDAALPGWRDGSCAALPELRAGGLVFNRNAPERLLEYLAGEPGAAPAIAGGDTAVIMFTSGTTGAPKGVEITHDNLLRASYAGAYHQAFQEGRRAVFSLPLYHGFGMVVGLLSGMVVGGAIIPLLRFDPHAILEAIGRHRAQYLMGVPTMTIALMEQAKRGDYDFSSLTAIHSAAAPTPSWVWEEIRRTFGCDEIITSYGQTEVTATVVCTAPGDPIEIVSDTQGRIVEGGIAGLPELGGKIAEFKTIDPASGDDLPWGSPGELCCRSLMNSKGYFRRPDATADLFLPGGWVRMGDLGQFRPDGNLFLTGRTKELYKSRGELVSPKELEQLLTQHDEIAQAFFIGMPDDQFGECGCAWVVRSDGSAITETDIREFLRQRVAAYKLPRDIWFTTEDRLPKTGTGKVQKALLREMALALLAEAGPAN